MASSEPTSTRLFCINQAYPIPNKNPSQYQLGCMRREEDMFCYKFTRPQKAALIRDMFPLPRILEDAIRTEEFYKSVLPLVDNLIDHTGGVEQPYKQFAALFNGILDASAAHYAPRIPKARFRVYEPDPKYGPGTYAPIDVIGLYTPVEFKTSRTDSKKESEAPDKQGPSNKNDNNSSPVKGKGEKKDKGKGKEKAKVEDDVEMENPNEQKVEKDLGAKAKPTVDPAWEDQLATFSVGPSWFTLENLIRPSGRLLWDHKGLTKGPSITMACYSAGEPRVQFIWHSTQLNLSPCLYVTSDFDLIARAIISLRVAKPKNTLEAFKAVADEMGFEEIGRGAIYEKDMNQLVGMTISNQPRGGNPVIFSSDDAFRCPRRCAVGRKSDSCVYWATSFIDKDGKTKEPPWLSFSYNVYVVERCRDPFDQVLESKSKRHLQEHAAVFTENQERGEEAEAKGKGKAEEETSDGGAEDKAEDDDDSIYEYSLKVRESDEKNIFT